MTPSTIDLMARAASATAAQRTAPLRLQQAPHDHTGTAPLDPASRVGVFACTRTIHSNELTGEASTCGTPWGLRDLTGESR